MVGNLPYYITSPILFALLDARDALARAVVMIQREVAERIVAKAGEVIASKDVGAAVTLESDDDAMDTLHRQLFTLVLSGELPTETIVDLTLLGRYYERFADHAVSVARRVVYLVTGAYHSDASVDHEDQEDAGAGESLRATLSAVRDS